VEVFSKPSADEQVIASLRQHPEQDATQEDLSLRGGLTLVGNLGLES
jgi:hypothetical protein